MQRLSDAQQDGTQLLTKKHWIKTKCVGEINNVLRSVTIFCHQYPKSCVNAGDQTCIHAQLDRSSDQINSRQKRKALLRVILTCAQVCLVIVSRGVSRAWTRDLA